MYDFGISGRRLWSFLDDTHMSCGFGFSAKCKFLIEVAIPSEAPSRT